MMPERAVSGQQNPAFRAYQAAHMLHTNNIQGLNAKSRAANGINMNIINILYNT